MGRLKMYKARLNTPGIQYWAKEFNPSDKTLVLTNIAKDAARLDGTDIPFLEGVVNETFKCGCIIEDAALEYIITLLEKYSEYDGEVPQISKTVSVEAEERPSIEEACRALKEFGGKDDEWREIGDNTWEMYDNYHEFGDPLWYCIKIQTPEQHRSMIDMFVAKIRYKATPKDVRDVK